MTALHMIEEAMYTTEASNSFYGAFGGHPLGLDTTLAKLRMTGQTALYDQLFVHCLAAEPIFQRLYGLGNLIKTINLYPPNEVQPVTWLTASAINARVAHIVSLGNSPQSPYQSFGKSVLRDDTVLDEPNGGARTNKLTDTNSVPLYNVGNTRTLTYSAKVKQVRYTRLANGRVQATTSYPILQVWGGASGPYISHTQATILNLQLLATCDDVADKAEAVGAVSSLIADIEAWQSGVLAMSGQIAALPGTYNFGYSQVPADILKRYPGGTTTLTYIDGSSKTL